MGKRCCFIHTENELKDSKKPASASNTGNISASKSSDLYGSVDLIMTEDSPVMLNEFKVKTESISFPD